MLIQSPPQKHVSNEDRSVNFVWPVGNPNDMLEARFVRRTDDYFIVYVSSHSGCNQACRFCHLTATKQAGMLPAALDDLLTQADAVFGYYDQQIRTGSQPPAQRVNINWMARGEPLLNDTLVVNGARSCLMLWLSEPAIVAWSISSTSQRFFLKIAHWMKLSLCSPILRFGFTTRCIR